MDFSTYGSPSSEWLSFLERNPAAAQDGLTGNDPAQASTLRAASNKTRSQTSAKIIAEEHLDQQVRIATVHIPSRGHHTIPLRIYAPTTVQDGALGVVLYFHGGGYLLGDETTDDAVCCRIAAKTRAVVVSVIYRHTDEHKHPAQVDDAWDAFQHVRRDAAALQLPIDRGLVVMGISCGCTLAASVVLRELEESRKHASGRTPIITGALLAIPWLIHRDNFPMDLFRSPEVSSRVQHADAPVIPTPRLKLFSDLLGAQDVTDRFLNVPLLGEDELKGWPRTVFQVAGADPLRDDGLLFADKLERMSVPTRVHVYPGLPHGFRRWTQLPATRAFDADSIDSITWLLGQHEAGDTGGRAWQVYEARTH